MTFRTAHFAFSMLLTMGTAASAKPYYFHKASVAREAFLTDYGECNELAGGIRKANTSGYQPNIYAAAAAGFIAGFMDAREARHRKDNVLRTCMFDKGYQRREVDDAVRDRIRHLPADQQMDALFAMATATVPVGEASPQ